jgi:hypothetical protein
MYGQLVMTALLLLVGFQNNGERAGEKPACHKRLFIRRGAVQRKPSTKEALRFDAKARPAESRRRLRTA